MKTEIKMKKAMLYKMIICSFPFFRQVCFYFHFVIFFAILTLDSAIWRVIVDGDIIKYRSFYGITRTYNFNDITKGVYTKKGSLKIYIEGKRIFTFYDNLEFSLFENQMRKRKIPLEYKRKEK